MTMTRETRKAAIALLGEEEAFRQINPKAYERLQRMRSTSMRFLSKVARELFLPEIKRGLYQDSVMRLFMEPKHELERRKG